MSNETPARFPFAAENPSPADSGDVQVPVPYLPAYTNNAFQPAPVVRPKLRKHIALFLLTFATTTAVGALNYGSFVSELGRLPVHPSWSWLLGGLWYSVPLLAILGAHEMGHYLFCRRYNISASLPYFIPLFFPLPVFQTGTLGAVIRIRERFPNKRILFDIGIAGPIAGFVVLLPVLCLGILWSGVVPAPKAVDGMVFLGKPLLYRAISRIVVGELPSGYMLNLHPMVFAAWFGMLATSLNLLPFGQLDGGHITYATLGRLSRPLSIATLVTAIGMAVFLSTGWVAMTALLIVMTLLVGVAHPPVIDEWEPIGRARHLLALLALVLFVLCFIPVPLYFPS